MLWPHNTGRNPFPLSKKYLPRKPGLDLQRIRLSIWVRLIRFTFEGITGNHPADNWLSSATNVWASTPLKWNWDVPCSKEWCFGDLAKSSGETTTFWWGCYQMSMVQNINIATTLPGVIKRVYSWENHLWITVVLAGRECWKNRAKHVGLSHLVTSGYNIIWYIMIHKWYIMIHNDT